MKDLGILPIANQNKPNPAEAPTEPETSGSNAVLVAAAAAVAVFFVTKKKKS